MFRKILSICFVLMALTATLLAAGVAPAALGANTAGGNHVCGDFSGLSDSCSNNIIYKNGAVVRNHTSFKSFCNELDSIATRNDKKRYTVKQTGCND